MNDTFKQMGLTNVYTYFIGYTFFSLCYQFSLKKHCLHFVTTHPVFHHFEHHLMPVFSQKMHIIKIFCWEIVFNILLLAGCGQRIEHPITSAKANRIIYPVVDFKADFE